MRLAVALLALSSIVLSAESGFVPLFDGETLTGWTVLPRNEPTGEWRAEGKVLLVEGRPGNLSTSDEYADFELRLEWKLGELGNSGVFYRFVGTGNPVAAAIEYQLADNARPSLPRACESQIGVRPTGLYPPQGGLVSSARRMEYPPDRGAWRTGGALAQRPQGGGVRRQQSQILPQGPRRPEGAMASPKPGLARSYCKTTPAGSGFAIYEFDAWSEWPTNIGRRE